MDITVLISTWNDAPCLAITLQVFKQCIIPDGVRWELVVVNNNCTDNTDEVVREYSKFLPINYVKEPRPGLSHARNTGLKAASGRLIIFTDDDVKPSHEWIKIYWEAFTRNPSGQFWGGPVASEYEGRKPSAELLRVAPFSVKGLDFGLQEQSLPEKKYFISANWAAPLADIRAAGGFDPRRGLNPQTKQLITGEESDLMDRLRARGLKGLYLPQAQLRHFVPKAKCTLEHIVARCEAGALEQYDKYRFRLGSVVFLNKPVGLYLHALYHYARYGLKRLIGKGGEDDYVKMRIVLTLAKAGERRRAGSKT